MVDHAIAVARVRYSGRKARPPRRYACVMRAPTPATWILLAVGVGWASGCIAAAILLSLS